MRWTVTRTVLLSLSLVAAAAAAQEEPSTPSLEILVRQSNLIFSGTVDRLQAATMPQVPVNEWTAVVTVGELYTPAEVLGDLSGREITVQLTESSELGAGDRAVFFTRSWIYGDSLAVIEVGHLPWVEETKATAAAIARVRERLEEEKVLARLDRAAVVIEGRVLETRPVGAARRGPISEHSPDWWEAVIRVRSVLKGELASPEVVVLFANSEDEVWLESPKLRPGQEAVWLLQRDQQEKGAPGVRLEGYTALDPLDLQPLERLDTLDRLLGYPRRQEPQDPGEPQ